MSLPHAENPSWGITPLLSRNQFPRAYIEVPAWRRSLARTMKGYGIPESAHVYDEGCTEVDFLIIDAWLEHVFVSKLVRTTRSSKLCSQT